MSTLVQHSADVRYNEIDMTQSIAQSSSANAGIAFVSAQGREGLFHITTADQFVAEYGNPNPAVSFGHYCALDFLREGNSLWALRVLGSGYAYSGSVLSDSAGVTELDSVTGGLIPTNIDWATIAGANTPLLAFYPKHGPGSYGDSIAVQFVSDNILNTTAPAASITATSGGTVGTGAHSYKVSAISAVGETLASSATTVTNSGTTNINTVTWTAVAGARGYSIYGNIGALTPAGACTAALVVTGTGNVNIGTHSYKVTFVTAEGETQAGSASNVVTTDASNKQVSLTAIPVGGTGTTSRKVYRTEAGGSTYKLLTTVSGNVATTYTDNVADASLGVTIPTANTTGEKLMATVGATVTSFIDDGSITPDISMNPILASASSRTLPTPTDTFTINVFDTSFSSSVPKETWKVTLESAVDGTGQNSEASQKLTIFSSYVNCVSNVPALLSVPTIVGISGLVNLTDGTSGTAPTNGTIQLAWDDFADRELVDVDLLINGGYTDVGIQQELETIARTRGTAVALLDMPQTSQSAQAMIDYRNLTLNLNSSYAAIFGPDVLESDPYNGQPLYVPFSGWAAALCARTDRVANPWWSIAGLNRGLVNVLASRYKFTEGERNALFDAQVNYTRAFPGQGIALWEQVTMQANLTALSWLSVRRLVNIVKKSTYQTLLYEVQEPNDDFARKQLIEVLSGYLQGVQNARGISAYAVVSNTDNNPPDQYNAGILRVAVFITPIIPIHEIQVDLVITKQGVVFSEINISNL